MKRALRAIALAAGIISATALVVLGFIYLEEATSKINGTKKFVFDRVMNSKLMSKVSGTEND